MVKYEDFTNVMEKEYYMNGILLSTIITQLVCMIINDDVHNRLYSGDITVYST